MPDQNIQVCNKDSSVWRVFWKQKYLQLFVLLGLVFLLVFFYAPMVGLIMGFKAYSIEMGFKGIFISKWVGLQYFKEFVTDYNFWPIVKNTIAISLLKLVFTFPIPIIFAVMLNEVRSKTFKRIVQTSSYLPYFISWVVVAGFAVSFLNTQNGVVNELLILLHLIKQPVSFLTDSNGFWTLAVVTGVWKDMGWWTIIFLAAITGVDPTLFEAATIDGAGRMQKIFYVTLPSITPTITIVLILALGNLLGGGLGGSSFEQCYLLGNPGNRDASEILQTYVFRVGLSNGRYAYATAVGFIQSGISVILVYFSNIVAKKISGNGLF